MGVTLDCITLSSNVIFGIELRYFTCGVLNFKGALSSIHEC